eukprot:s5140_g2.t1
MGNPTSGGRNAGSTILQAETRSDVAGGGCPTAESEALLEGAWQCSGRPIAVHLPNSVHTGPEPRLARSADSTEVTLQRVDSKIDEILRKLDEWSPQVHQAHEQMVARLLKGIQGSLSTDLASTGDVSSENLLAQAPAAEAGTSSQGSKQMRHRQPPLRHVTEEVVLETDLSGSRCSSAGGNSAKDPAGAIAKS